MRARPVITEPHGVILLVILIVPLFSSYVLAIEGINGNLTLAVGSGRKTAPLIHRLSGYSQDAHLFRLLDECCNVMKVSPQEFCRNLSRLGVIRGPGSYTGIRLACALVNSLAIANPVPIHTPDAFDLLDAHIHASHLKARGSVDATEKATAGMIRVLLPASRRRDYFWQIRLPAGPYIQGNLEDHELWQQHLVNFDPRTPVILAGEDAQRFVEAIRVKITNNDLQSKNGKYPIIPDVAAPQNKQIFNPDMMDILWQDLISLPEDRLAQLPHQVFPLYFRPADVSKRKSL